MPKNSKKEKKRKNRTNFELKTDSIIEKYLTISKQFKIRISPPIVKTEDEKGGLNQIRHCLARHVQISHNFI